MKTLRNTTFVNSYFDEKHNKQLKSEDKPDKNMNTIRTCFGILTFQI